jgi:hypothetical protein
MNRRSPLDTLPAVAFAVALFEPIAVDPVSLLVPPRAAAGDFIASLRAAGEAGDWLVVAVGRFVLSGLAVPGVFCAETAAAMQNDTTPAARTQVEKRIFDMMMPPDEWQGRSHVE